VTLSPKKRSGDIRKKQNTRYAWAGGTFFPVVLLCQFCVLVGIKYILLMYLEYHTVVVLY